MIIETLRTLASLSLRRLGLTVGRSLNNAKPSPATVRTAQLEQFAHATARIAREQGQVALLSRIRTPLDTVDAVDVLVFSDGALTHHPLDVDAELLLAIYGPN